ncbi:hypothetical protein JCGZ_19822 [Jatropha curcas]|uniref:Uncharacterized protein n=1 Tax=Jatropha curcas TaxID=180498 RepID=A0A067K7D7_JATCU|nr:hypothetical protein JCGZ_19822 [Jatropha curcas]
MGRYKIAAKAVNNHHDTTHPPFKHRNGTVSSPRQFSKSSWAPSEGQPLEVEHSQIKAANWRKIAAEVTDNHHGVIRPPVKCRNCNSHQQSRQNDALHPSKWGQTVDA